MIELFSLKADQFPFIATTTTTKKKKKSVFAKAYRGEFGGGAEGGDEVQPSPSLTQNFIFMGNFS